MASLVEFARRMKAVRWLNALLAVLVPFFAVATVAMPTLLVRSQQAVERVTRHDIAWTGARGQEELQHLAIQALRFALFGDGQRREEVDLYYQILLGRLETWRSGAFAQFTDESPERSRTMLRLLTVVTAMEAPISRLGEPGEVRKLDVLLDEADRLMNALSGEAFTFSTEALLLNRRTLTEMQTTQQWLLMGLLGSGMLLVALMVFQNRLLRRAHADQKAEAERYAFVATHDVLTELPNRATFRAALARADGPHLAVLAIDLDGFKPINDTLGHMAGDAVLVSVARRLEAAITDLPGSIASRFGGDEFFVLLKNVHCVEVAMAKAEEIIALLRQAHDLDGQRLVVNATIGLAFWDATQFSPETLMRNADLAMNRAKHAGKDGIVIFAPDMAAEIDERRRLEAELKNAIERGEFEPYYQPQVDMATRRIKGVEALVRWTHPERGILAPGSFISVAESSGLIVDIGRAVLEKACRDAAAFPQPISVSVNLSTVQLVRADIPTLVRECLEKSGLPARRLTLEITESVMMRDEARCREIIRRLRGMGVAVALDDFGTGYSSLSYLRGFGFDELKIDRSFVSDVGENRESIGIVQTIAALGRHLGLKVVAEGIETEKQAVLLMSIGCNTGQGYLYSRPMPAEAIAAMLRNPVEQTRETAPRFSPHLLQGGLSA